MTVEKAYYQLAGEGYILRRSKARYEVASVRVPRKADRPRSALEEAAQSPAAIAYDFGSGDLAAEAFPLAVWRKLMNRVLHEPDLLLANQDEQGAPVLRHVLSQYIYQTRGVQAGPENLIIGSGTGALLTVLLNLLHDRYPQVAVEEPGFRLGRELFRTGGFEIVPIPVREGCFSLPDLAQSGARLVYVSPSHQFPTGAVMPADSRYDLLNWAHECDGLIIEDDYDSELRYQGRPIPALQSLDRAGRVIYMGAFSKILPPFVRLSYMVLPAPLLQAYTRRRVLFRQGASVPEQCVLAEYIRTGGLARQVRRLRKEYQEKGALLAHSLQAAFGAAMRVSPVVSGVYCHVVLQSDVPEEVLLARAASEGCRVLSVRSFYEKSVAGTDKEFLLSFSKIPAQELTQAVAALRRAWLEKEGN